MAFATLAFQNTALTLVMKFSYRSGAKPYSQVEAILLSEVCKLVISCLLVCIQGGLSELGNCVRDLRERPLVVVPSVLYVAQNNLIFIAVKNLSSSVYIVSSQGKIISSCFFTSLLLGKKFTKKQYYALLILIVGIINVQIGSNSPQDTFRASLLGVYCMLGVNISSGYAGALLERLFKCASLSIWQRNVQLSLSSVAALLLMSSCNFRGNSRSIGVFPKHDPVVLSIVILSSFGGLVTAFVMRYASAVLKCYAVSLSICLCTIVDAYQDVNLSWQTYLGIMFVFVSLLLYN